MSIFSFLVGRIVELLYIVIVLICYDLIFLMFVMRIIENLCFFVYLRLVSIFVLL